MTIRERIDTMLDGDDLPRELDPAWSFVRKGFGGRLMPLL